MASTLVAAANGSASSSPNSACSVPPAASATRSRVPVACVRSAVPPMIANQTALAPLGTSRTPVRNCRTVRPREIRAMNVPTNGAQEIHHAQ